MIKITKYLAALAAAGLLSFQAHGGTISYVPIPAANSDASAGIGPDNVYTSAISGGNTTGTDRVINGVTLTSLPGTGNTSTAGGITVNALSGSLTNSAGAAGSIAADGTLAATFQNMLSNNGAADGSQQEVVIDPATLTAGKTYDLRVYICNSAGQDRQVNLSFACDGQAPVETGFFNEDDATTSGGAFADKNQVYYINYRFTWDGATTPGITVTQKSGAIPFLLYAVTNQEVTSAPAAQQPVDQQPVAVDQEPVGSGPGPDVGVESDQFYDDDGLNRHGRWVEVGRYGRCWQPEGVAEDWAPYTRGQWVHSNYGWTWVSDEQEDDWGWATYHYGRWSRVEDAGWVWIPGRVWAPAWVSWRHNDSCVGWAPLPPEAICAAGVGISIWADSSYGLGPGAYNFVSVRNFGAPDMAGVLYPRQRNVEFIQSTRNVTNIVNNNSVIYNGGPNVNTLNAAIIHDGGQPVQTGLMLNRRGTRGPVGGGRFSQVQGNVLTLAGPRVAPTKNLAGLKPAAATFKSPKIDKGWNQVSDPKAAADLRKKIAMDTKGKTPATTKAVLPAGVTLAPATAVAGATSPAGLHPGKGFKNGAVTGSQTPGATTGPLHPGQKFQGITNGQGAPASGGKHPGQAFNPAAVNGSQPATTPAGGLHPGQKFVPAATTGVAAQPSTTPGGKKHSKNGNAFAPATAPTAAPAALHPGQALPAQQAVVAQPTATPAGKKHGKNANAFAPVTAPTTAPGVTQPGQTLPAQQAVVAQPTATPAGKRHGKNANAFAPVTAPTAAPVVPQPGQAAAGTQAAVTQPIAPTAGKKHGKNANGLAPVAPPANVGTNPASTPQTTPVPRHPGGQNPQAGQAAAAQQQQASAAAAAKQQQQGAAAQQQAAAAKQQQQAAAAAKQQQQAGAAAAAKQQHQAEAAAARQQQQAGAAAAAKQQQQAEAAAARQQQQAGAAAAAKQQQQAAAAQQQAGAARQQQQAAAAQQQAAAARQQQQAAAAQQQAAAARQQQAAAAAGAAARQQQAAAAGAGKGGKPGASPTPTPH